MKRIYLYLLLFTAFSIVAEAAFAKTQKDIRNREIRVGVMLPLHNINGDGKRMVEYYRGLLMACDSLKAGGISVDVRAWNLAEDGDMNKILSDPHAADRDIIIGPLYSKQMPQLAEYTLARDILLFVPFSITSQDFFHNSNIFQVFQNGNTTNHAYVFRMLERFKDCHPIIVDCNDSTSTKGSFTTVLRRELEQRGIKYSITNLKSPDTSFKSAFVHNQRNVVVLNTSHLNELNIAFARLNSLAVSTPGLVISMFGYPEWLMFTRQHLENFYKFDTYIPSTYYMNPLSGRAVHFKKQYRRNFHQDMQPYHQRYAATGFDHGYYMLKGLHLLGKRFLGARGSVGYTPLQTPLHFERIGNGGLQNKAFVFVHYTTDNRVETINF